MLIRNLNFIVLTLLFTFMSFQVHAWTNDSVQFSQIDNPQNCIDLLKKMVGKSAQEIDLNFESKTALDSFLSSADFWEQNLGHDLGEISWDLFPKFVKTYSLLKGLNIEKNESFQRNGYAQGTLNQDLMCDFLIKLKLAKIIPLKENDYDENYTFTKIGGISEDLLNNAHTYFELDNNQAEILHQALVSLQKPVAECIGTPWRVVNTRVWKTSSKISEDGGALSWHKDGFPLSALKIMIYPLGASYKLGTTEFMLPEGTHAIEGIPGTWVLFKNSEIVHRGRAPQEDNRVVIEITIVPSMDYDLWPICAGLNSRHPILPWQAPLSSKHFNQPKAVLGINIGGGPYWSSPGWLNLEGVASASNPHPFYLHPTCYFPLRSGSVKNVYTSHTIEHLDAPTVQRAFSECQRVLQKGGNFIIKIPDYDAALDSWRRHDRSFFGPEWAIDEIIHTWKSKGVCDCLDHRASMVFCSFWNSAYGNHFDPAVKRDLSQGYYGPPPVEVSFLRKLIENNSPAYIVKELCRVVETTQESYSFCHQSAWSREELKQFLKDFGFEVVSFDKNEILNAFSDITGIKTMLNESMFCWARKI